MTVSKKQKKKRRGNYSLQYSVIIFIAFAIFMTLSLTVFFKITTVSIHGSSIYTPDEIAFYSGIESGDNLIRTNMRRSSEAIRRELVYIETAAVRRSFPSTVKITVDSAVEATLVESGGIWYLLSESGKILDISAEPISRNLITFYGTDAYGGLNRGDKFESNDSRKTDNIYELLEKLNDGTDFSHMIKSVDITDRHDIILNFDDRINIAIGSITELDYKFRYSDTLLRMNIGTYEQGTLTFNSDSVSFISLDGVIHNEEVYQGNVNRLNQEEAAALMTAESVENGISETNFE